MTESRHEIDEALISGYLDGELTQGEAQRVRIHIEDCAACRATADELTKLKEVTMDSRFKTPGDVQWDEAPRSGTSRLARNAGIVIGLAWLVAVVGLIVVELAGSVDVLGFLLVGGFVLSAALLIGSVWLNRREADKTDRYRRVKK